MEGNIYKAIPAIIAEIGAVGKNSKNQAQGFMYRGIDAVMNAINPALVKFKVFVVPEIMEQTREERTNAKGTTLIYSVCKIRYHFIADDGSEVTAVVIGEGMDSGDKATNKAMSIAFKYACFQVFCIPTEEMVDPDAECHEVQPKKAVTSQPQRRQTPQTPPPKEEPKPAQKMPTLIDAVRAEFAKAGIDEAYAAGCYKLPMLEAASDRQLNNMLAHIEDIKNAQEGKR